MYKHHNLTGPRGIPLLAQLLGRPHFNLRDEGSKPGTFFIEYCDLSQFFSCFDASECAGRKVGTICTVVTYFAGYNKTTMYKSPFFKHKVSVTFQACLECLSLFSFP